VTDFANEPGLREVAERVHAISREKGFDVPHWDENFPIKVVLFITELDEAVQFVEGIGKDPVEVELGDTAIRILSTLHAIWGDAWSPGRIETRALPKHVVGRNYALYVPIEVAVWPIIRYLCGAIEQWRKSKPGEDGTHKREAMICIELALLETFRLADLHGANLREIIEAKAVKNAARPPLHGKGRSVG
jgi:hypothetical protein